MACCARAAPLLLTHVNLLLFLYAGASLATAARLKWDPSTYVMVREMFPEEYRMSAIFFCVGGLVLLLLGHLCATALCIRRTSARRVLLLLYAVMMAALVAIELAFISWMGLRMAEFLRSTRAKQLAQVTPLVEDLKKILDKWSFLEDINRIRTQIEEAEHDLVSNVYVVEVCAGLFCVLQPLAIVLALLAAAASRRTNGLPGYAYSCGTTSTRASVEKWVEGDRDAEKAPLRTAYRNGRIIIL